MKVIAALACFFLSMACHSQERGRVYLDHMSIEVPSNWQQSVIGRSITFTAPFRVDTLYDRCSISINAAGKSTGGPLEVLALVDRNMPGNLEKENIPPVQTLSNGWQATERIYRNYFARGIYNRAIVTKKDGVGQVLIVSNSLSGCQAFTDPVIKTLQINDLPSRYLATGAPLLLPESSSEGTGRSADHVKAGTVCRAGGVSCLNGGAIGSPCMCASTSGPQFGTVF